MNPTPEDILLFEGKTLGYVHEVDAVTHVIANEEHNERELNGNVANYPVCSIHSQTADQKQNQNNAQETSNSEDEMASYSEVDMSAWCKDLHELYSRSCDGLNPDQQVELARLIDRHLTCFSTSPTDLGRTSILKHEIDTGDAQPVKTPPRRPPMAFEGEQERVIQQQLDAGVFRPSTSPWASALVYVRKKCGGVRACVDYRRVNDLTKKCAYPIPKISECLDCLGDAKIFSTLDLQSGYWQIEVKEEDIPKTVVITRGGLYEYVTMPIELCGAPSTFTRCIELIFRQLQWKTSNTEVAFLGHIVTRDGVKKDPAKVEAIREWPIPNNLTDIRSFLGITSYYRRFIQGYSKIARPLNHLLEAGQDFVWNEECQEAFERLKEILMSDIVMVYPNNHDLFILNTDASKTAIGATLSQVQWNDAVQERWNDQSHMPAAL